MLAERILRDAVPRPQGPDPLDSVRSEGDADREDLVTPSVTPSATLTLTLDIRLQPSTCQGVCPWNSGTAVTHKQHPESNARSPGRLSLEFRDRPRLTWTRIYVWFSLCR